MRNHHRATNTTDRSPLAVAEQIFQRSVHAPGGLALDGRALSHELPARQIPLTELRDLLNSGSLPHATRELVWRELVVRGRHDGTRWLAGAVGVALPILCRIAGRLGHYVDAKESVAIDTAVLAAFLVAVRDIDLDQPGILSRLCAAAGQAGERVRQRTERVGARHTSADADGEVERTPPSAIACNEHKTSVRSRITSDPQPINTEPKGGWGSPTGSARIPAPRSRCLFRGATTAAVVAVVVAATAAAVLADSKPAPTPAPAPSNLTMVFDNMRNWIIGLLAALATLMLTVGGLRYLVAGGDPGEVQKAKAALKAAAFGYGLAVLAPLFVSVLKRIVGGE
jgi:hypothetical protein